MRESNQEGNVFDEIAPGSDQEKTEDGLPVSIVSDVEKAMDGINEKDLGESIKKKSFVEQATEGVGDLLRVVEEKAINPKVIRVLTSLAGVSAFLFCEDKKRGYSIIGPELSNVAAILAGLLGVTVFYLDKKQRKMAAQNNNSSQESNNDLPELSSQ